MTERFRVVSEEDLANLWTIGAVSIDPSGRLLALSLARPDFRRDHYASRIAVVDRNSGKMAYWTEEGHDCSCPAWSPDGRWLTFLSARSGQPTQLYGAPTTGGEPRCLTTLQNGVESYAWSPDSRWIVLVATSGDPWGPSVEATVEPRVIETLQYKADGRGFIFDQWRHLFLLPVTCKEEDQPGPPMALTRGPYDDLQPAWAPDSIHIAFVSARHASRERDLGQDVFLVNRESLAIRQVTQTQGMAAWPCWSPDGQHIAYVGTDRLRSQPSHRRIGVVSATGGPQQIISRDLDRTVAMVETPPIAWVSPKRVAGLFEDEGRVNLFEFDVVARRLVCGDRFNAWQVSAWCPSPDGTWRGLVASSPRHPPEVFEQRPGWDPPRALTHLHDAWCDAVRLSEMEAYSAASADGTEVPCWIMRPIEGEGSSVPGLLAIHGGPYAQYGYQFNHEFQYWCGLGYAVVFCNPRGSSGYAESWARDLGTQRGIMDYEDVMACMDSALARYPFIDPDRLAVNGYSYGGYMTSWIVGHTNRFRVACSEAAPNNLYSTLGSTDLTATNYPLVMGFTAQENPAFYMERSPISYVAQIQTPVLITHGEDDMRVSIEQGEQFFVALRHRGIPVRFIRFPGQNHGFRRTGRPSYRRFRLKAIREWFDRFLIQPPSGQA